MTRPSPLGDTTAVTLTPLTDWHVGSGHGVPGSVDATVRRDADDLPYVPGTTLTGLLRDACATVAHALDDGGAAGVWQRWHEVAFGSGPQERAGVAPRPAAVGIGAARLSPALRREITAEPALAAATTSVRVGVRIDDATGRAQDDMLRFVEMARGGLPLRAELTLARPVDDDAAAALTALLVLGAAWCDRMGGDRRRGPGEVRLALAGQDATAWARWLADSSWVPAEPQTPTTAAPAPVAPIAAGAGGWRAVELAITTSAPVRVPAAVSGNVVRGHDHLPGAALLPWLSDRWGADLVRRGVADGLLVVRHAHPEVDGRRGLPAPLVLHRAKSGGDTATVGEPTPGQRPVRDRWTVADPAGTLPLQVRATAQVSHNTVDRTRQRPVGAGGVFELEVIPAGRVLHGRVLLAPGLVSALETAHGPGWAQRLAGAARLGSRRGGEYGAVAVTASDAAPEPVPPPPSGQFRLWLTSDALVRDAGLRYSARPADLRDALAALLGVPGLALADVTARTRRTDGWQGRWQLPRESTVGLAAGTVVEVVLPGPVDPQGWRTLLVQGIGERRAEGFGEVVVDPPLLRTASWEVAEGAPASVSATAAAEALDPDERVPLELLRRVVRREEVVAAVAGARTAPPVDALRTALARLSRSQRGTWRAVTADAAVAGRVDRITAHTGGWLANQSSRRDAQREVARQLAALAGGDVDAVLGLGSPDDRLFALAALVADLVRELADRQPEEDDA